MNDAVLWAGILPAAYVLMQFLGSPVHGAVSDQDGRRPVLLGSLAVMALLCVRRARAGSL